MKRFPLLAITTLVLPLPLFAALTPAPAEACSFSPSTVLVNDPPANGVLVLHAWCGIGSCFGDPVPGTLTVTDLTTLTAVTGTIVRVRESSDEVAVAWRPDAPFVEGRSYELDWNPLGSDAQAQVDLQFTAQPPATWTLADLAQLTQLDRLTLPTKTVECETRSVNSCGGTTATIYVEQKQVAMFTVTFESETQPPGAHRQYVTRFAFWAEGEPEPALGEGTWPFQAGGLEFDESENTYCYRVELTSLIDDSTEERSDCVEHDQLGGTDGWGTGDIMLASQLTQCKAPPAGLEAEWCAGMRVRCREPNPLFGCDTVEATCEGVDALGLPDAGTADPEVPTTGGDGDGDGDGDGRTDLLDDDAAQDGAAAGTDGSSTCSVTHVGHGIGSRTARGALLSALAFLLAFGALAHGVRRREALRRRAL